MNTTYGHIQLQFEAEFSNVLIVHITCHASLEPKLNVQELVSVLHVISFLNFWRIEQPGTDCKQKQ